MRHPDLYADIGLSRYRLLGNPLLGGCQLYFWFFVSPSLWRSLLNNIDEGLSPGFSLSDLRRDELKAGPLREILVKLLAAWPVLFLSISVLSLLGAPAIDIVLKALIIGSVVGVASTLLLVTLVSLAGGASGGLLLSVVSSATYGYFSGTIVDVEALIQSPALGPPLDLIVTSSGHSSFLIPGSALALSVGVVGHLAARHGPGVDTAKLGRSLLATILGLLVAASGLGLVLLLLDFLSHYGATVLILTYVFVGSMVLLCASAAIVTSRRPMFVGVVTLICGLSGSLAASLVIGSDGFVQDLGLLGLVALFLGVPYCLAFSASARLTDMWSGALSGSATFLLAVSLPPILAGDPPPAVLSMAIYGAMIPLGLLVAWWQPVILYPLTALWNELLVLLERWRPGENRDWFRFNSAFWDDYQRLPVGGLSAHLSKTVQNEPKRGQELLDYFLPGAQRGAALSAYVDVAITTLEACTDINSIDAAAERIPVFKGTGAIGIWLRRFSIFSEDARAALAQANLWRRRTQLENLASEIASFASELAVSRERRAKRFYRIATRWRDIVSDHAIHIGESADLLQEIQNPYVVGIPLNVGQEMFVGRTEISSRLANLILGSQTPPILLYGQRRMGKTSLLKNLPRLLPNSVVPLFVQLQGRISLSKDYDRFLYNLAGQMVVSARNSRGISLPTLEIEAVSIDPFTRFDEWLDEVEEVVDSGIFLLALDEFESLDAALEAGAFDEEHVLGTLRSIVQNRDRIKVLLAGSHTIEEFRRWSNYLINAEVVKIDYLSAPETAGLVERPVRDFRLQYKAEVIRTILEITRCHPALVQLLLRTLVDLKNSQPINERRLASMEDVETATRLALSRGRMFFDDIEVNQVSDRGLAMLRFLASRGPFESVSESTFRDRFKDRFDTEIQLLLRRDLVEKSNDGYRFQVEMIRRWFASEHDS